jgi:hypothetical protein
MYRNSARVEARQLKKEAPSAWNNIHKYQYFDAYSLLRESVDAAARHLFVDTRTRNGR